MVKVPQVVYEISRLQTSSIIANRGIIRQKNHRNMMQNVPKSMPTSPFQPWCKLRPPRTVNRHKYYNTNKWWRDMYI